MDSASWSVPARPESVSCVRECLARFARKHGAAPEVEQRLKLAVSEALSNAVLHAYPPGDEGIIEIRAEDPGDEIVVEIKDDGRGVKPRPDSPGLGLGLPLIAQLTDRFTVSSVRGTAIHMSFSTR